MSKFEVGLAKGPRNSPYTFEENGFFRVFKKRALPILKKVEGNKPYKKIIMY